MSRLVRASSASFLVKQPNNFVRLIASPKPCGKLLCVVCKLDAEGPSVWPGSFWPFLSRQDYLPFYSLAFVICPGVFLTISDGWARHGNMAKIWRVVPMAPYSPDS